MVSLFTGPSTSGQNFPIMLCTLRPLTYNVGMKIVLKSLQITYFVMNTQVGIDFIDFSQFDHIIQHENTFIAILPKFGKS